MENRRVDGFFYGLFMDSDVLSEKNIEIVEPRRAYAVDFALQIGQRATLVPSTGERAYGMLYSLTQKEFERLYQAPALEHYRPEAILTRSLDGQTLPAICYNLPETLQSAEANHEYTARLQAVLRKLDFPAEYIECLNGESHDASNR